MYELNFIRKRKRRIVAAIVGGVGSIGVTTLSIAAFLGRSVGSYTISLEAKNVKLTLSEKSDFVNRTSFLRLNDIGEFQEFTYQYFDKVGGDAAIDSEETDYTLGQNPDAEQSLNFLKYTFFIKNVGTTSAKYNIAVKINEIHASSAGRDFEDTFRVMMFDNGERTVYAKRLANGRPLGNGEVDYRAPISVSEADSTPTFPFQGYAEMFTSSSEVMHKDAQEINVDEVRRYTLVTWLEGFRSSGEGSSLEDATIKLGVEINAYED